MNDDTHKLDKFPSPRFERVLVVDDNYASRFVIKSQLARMRCEVSLAENGQVAVDMASVAGYDLILMDIQMPVMDGIAATRAIQTHGPNKDTPIIAITAYSLDDFNTNYDRGLFRGVLLKPFSARALMGLWLSNQQSRSVPLSESPLNHTAVLQVPLLDPQVLEPLCQAASFDILARVINRFWTSCADFSATMNANLPAAQMGHATATAEFRSAAQGLKGAAANLGLLRMSRICATLQNAKADTMAADLIALELSLAATRPELNSYIAIHSKAA